MHGQVLDKKDFGKKVIVGELSRYVREKSRKDGGPDVDERVSLSPSATSVKVAS